MNRTSSVVALALALVLTSSHAQADSIVIFPLEPASTDPDSAAAAEGLRASLVSAGHTAKVSEAPLSDAALAAGCDPAADACLASLATLLSVDAVVAFSSDGGGWAVRNVDTSGRAQTSQVAVSAGQPVDTDAWARRWYPEGTGAGAGTGSGAGTGDGNGAAPTGGAAPSSKKLRRTVQIAGIAGGGALMLVGAGLWASAAGKQGDIDDAPTATPAQIDALIALENDAASTASWGNRAFIFGALIAGAAATWFVLDRDREVEVAPVVTPDGAGVGATLSWRLP